MARRSTYSESQVAHAIALVTAKRGNVSAAARDLGMSHRTLQSWVDRTRRVPRTREDRVARASAVDSEREKLGLAWSRLTHQGIEAASERIASGTLGDRELASVIIAGTDKLLALMGPPQPQTSVTINLAQLFRAHASDILPAVETIEVEPT